MTNLISTTNIERAGCLMQSILNLNPIAVLCLVGPCDNIFWSLSHYDQRNGPIPVPWLAHNEPSSEKQERDRTASKAELSPLMWYLWNRISLPWPRTGRRFTLSPSSPWYHHHAIPADQLIGSNMDRDPLQITAAENRTPLVLTVSTVSGYSTQLAPSVYERPLTHPWSHSSIHFFCSTCVREALEIAWGFLLFPPWEI